MRPRTIYRTWTQNEWHDYWLSDGYVKDRDSEYLSEIKDVSATEILVKGRGWVTYDDMLHKYTKVNSVPHRVLGEIV